MRTPSPASPPPNLFEAFKSFTPFHEIIHFYVDLNCALIGPTLPSKWWTLNRRIRGVSLYEMEKKYGQTEPRDRFLTASVHRARKDKKTFCGAYLGFRDFFVPVLRGGKVLGFLIAGAFADHELTRADILECWRKLAKKAPASGPDFQEFTRVLLEIPVLEGPVLWAYQESLELFTRLLAGSRELDLISARTLQLKQSVISKNLPHGKFMRWALGFEASESLPTWSLEIENWDWVRDEVGVTRIPTTVITVIPKAAGKRPDPLEEALRVYRFQRRCFLYGQTLPQTVGGKLENYGAVFVTSADPAKSRSQRKREMMDVAGRIHRFALKELGGPALVGVGESVPRGESLGESYRHAVLALHLGSQSGREIATHDSTLELGTKGLLELHRLLSALARQLALASLADLEVLQDAYLKQVLTLSFQNPVEIRWHLQYALIHLAEALRQRLHLGEKETDGTYQDLALSLEKAATTRDLVLGFKAALSKLLDRAERRNALDSTGSVRGTREYIDTHYRETLRIEALARMAGLSVSTFGRHFQKLTGMGLEPYLLNLRLEEAKRLLKTGGLPVSGIAQDCGFHSSAYFVKVFGKRLGTTPGEYRRKFQET